MNQPSWTYQADAPYILLIYAPVDGRQVLPEMNWLHRQEFNIRCMPVDQAETEWSPDLADGVDNAALILWFISADAMDSSGFRKIIDSATEHSVPLLRVYLQVPQPQSELTDSGMEADSILKLDLLEDDFRDQLVSSLSTVAAHTRIQPVSTPTMPYMSETGPPDLLQHGMVALAILILGMLVYLYVSPA